MVGADGDAMADEEAGLCASGVMEESGSLSKKWMGDEGTVREGVGVGDATG